MASIHKEITVEVTPETAWLALRRVGDAHELFTPVLVDGRLAGDTRTVRLCERHGRARAHSRDRRQSATRGRTPSWTARGMAYHHTSMQIQNAGPWGILIRVGSPTSFLKKQDPISPRKSAQGAAALKSNLQAS